MITAADKTEIGALLERHRSFEECLLREVRTARFGTAVELRFDYIWDDTDPAGSRVADEPRRVTVRLELVREAHFFNELPAGLIAEPDRADWGLTEVALVRLEESSELVGAHRARFNKPLHHLVVAWESDRRIDVIFERLSYFEET